tara:strand:- start:399 stop:989 length:591 start_codon:yes stop_codon:yes gene_type:complete
MTDSKWKKQKDFSVQDIQERLQGFTAMKEISELETGMQIRYISMDQKTNSKTLKMGGILVFIDAKGRYLRVKSLIGGNTKPWSVQIENSEIYYKDKNKDTKHYQTILDWIGGDAQDIDNIMEIMGGGGDLTKNIRYIRDNYGNQLISLVRSNKQLLEQYDKLQKSQRKYKERCKRLEDRLKGTQTGGMGLLDTADL